MWSCPHRVTVRPDILRDGFPMQPDLLGNRLERPALLRQVANLRIALAPLGVVRGHLCGGQKACGRLGGRGRHRRLDDSRLVCERQGEARCRPGKRL